MEQNDVAYHLALHEDVHSLPLHVAWSFDASGYHVLDVLLYPSRVVRIALRVALR